MVFGPWWFITDDETGGGGSTATSFARVAGVAVELDSAVTADATSIPLDTASWTVDPDMYPMLVDINGELVTATGASLTGTVTLTGVTRSLNNVVKAHSAGAPVQVADPIRATLTRRSPITATNVFVPPTDPGGGGGGGGACINTFVAQTSKPTLTPGTGGITRTVTNDAEWDVAAGAANPGDIVVIDYNPSSGRRWLTRSGAAGNHITITMADGRLITGIDDAWAGVTVEDVDHVDVVGVATTLGFYSIAYRNVHGTAGSPCKITHNNSQSSRWARIIVQDNDAGQESSYVDIEDNEIYGTAHPSSDHRSEGIYIGSGSGGYGDRTHHVNIRRNYIHDLESEGIEIKIGATDFVIEHNYVKNIDLDTGSGPVGAIGMWFTSGAVPADLLTANGICRYNRVNGYTSVDAHGAIAFSFGGIDIHDNLVWNHQHPGIRARGDSGASNTAGAAPSGETPVPNQIYNNTLIGDGIEEAHTGSPSVDIVSANNIYDGTNSGEYVYSAADFVGPTTGDAVAAGYSPGFDGDGSGFQLVAGSNANQVATGGQGLMIECPGVPDHQGAMPQYLAPA